MHCLTILLLFPILVFADSVDPPETANPLSESWRWREFHQLENVGVRCMAEAADSSLWFGGTAGLARYDGRNWQFYDSTFFDFSSHVNAILPTDSAVYVSSLGGLWRIQHDEWQQIFPTTWPPRVAVSELAEHNGAVWAATRLGLIRLQNGQLSGYTIASLKPVFNKLAPEMDVQVLPDRFAVREPWPEGGGVYAPSQVVAQLAPAGPAENAGIAVGDYLPHFLQHPNFELFFLTGPADSHTPLQVQSAKHQTWREKRLIHATFTDSISMFELEMLYIDRNDGLWLNVNGRLFFRVPILSTGEPDFSAAVQEEIPLRTMQSRALSMYHATDGRFWLISDDPAHGIVFRQAEESSWQRLDLASFGGTNRNLSIVETPDGMVWITGHSVVHGFDGKAWHVYTSEQTPLPSARLYGLFTRTRDFWVFGRSSQVFRIDYGTKAWQTRQHVQFQCRSKQFGDWYLHTDGGILQHHNDAWRRHAVLDIPMAVVSTSTSSVWVYGGDNNQAAVARYDGSKWYVYHFPQLSACIDYRAFCERSDSSLWFGAGVDAFNHPDHRGGIIRFEKQNSEWRWQHLAPPEVPKDVVNMVEDHEGVLWLSGWRLFKLDAAGLTSVNQPIELTTAWIDVMHVDPVNGDLWISKGGVGLFQKSESGWRLHTRTVGLADNLVSALLSDTLNHRIWAATPNGICAYDVKRNEWKSAAMPREITVGREGGTLRQTPDGCIWLNQAPRSWYKRFLQPSTFSQPLVCVRYAPDSLAPETTLDVYSERVQQPGNVLMTWSGADIWQRSETAALQFSTRLDGGEWSPFSPDRQTILLDVPDGRHTFEVRAQDRDFNIDPTPARIEFRVVPPIWKQAWFLALVLTFLTIIAVYEIRLINRNQKIHELDMLKLRLFTNISHELRTPLTLILGPLEKLQAAKDSYDAAARRSFDVMHRNATRLLALVNQIMDFRKLEDDSLVLEPSRGDFVRFIQRELDVFEPVAAEKNIALQFNSEATSILAEFDPDKMLKILHNLIGNAVKFTPAGGSVSARLQKTSDTIHLIIQDTGIGIPEKQLPRLFEQYYQIQDKRAQSEQGTGIGLSLTRELVELHGGSISVSSQIDMGTRFDIHLPIAVRANATDNESDVDDSRPCVLVVDDHADIRNFVAQDLIEYRILQAKDGKSGFELAIEQVPDAIIADVLMPNMNGLELTTALKQHELTSHIPIILLTARSSKEYQVAGLQTGADEYLTKPFQADVLKTRLQNLIKIRRDLRTRFQKEIWLKPQDIAITPHDEKFLTRVMQVIENHMDDDEFNVNVFARETGLSLSSLHSKLKALTGQTCTEFIHHQRMKRAANLMVEGKLTAKEASFQVGFMDQSYFSRVFKQVFGQSPTQYVKSHSN